MVMTHINKTIEDGKSVGTKERVKTNDEQRQRDRQTDRRTLLINAMVKQYLVRRLECFIKS